MAIFTKKDYEARPRQGVVSTIKELKKLDDVKITTVTKTRKKKLEKVTYHLFHPENGQENDLQDFEDIIKIDGKEYSRICKNGMVKTEDKELMDFLLRKGYEFIGEIDGNK